MLRSVTEPIETATSMGDMILAILASSAAEEGCAHKPNAGPAEKNQQAEADWHAAQLARLSEGPNLLNEGGRCTNRGDRFHASTVQYILDNPKYLGLVRVSRTDSFKPG